MGFFFIQLLTLILIISQDVIFYIGNFIMSSINKFLDREVFFIPDLNSVFFDLDAPYRKE